MGEPVRVKICGVTAPEHALAAAEAGADYVGLNFAPESRRYLTVEQAQTIVAALRAAYPQGGPALVGVFVNEKPDKMAHIAETLGLDLVQLSGDEPWDVLYALPRPAIKAYRIPNDASVGTVVAEVQAGQAALAATGSRTMLDAAVTGAYGGTGQRADWSVAAELARHAEIVLAGGLTPENVAEAVARVQPWGVDVSSGVETGGVKDAAKIRAFVRAVRRTERAGSI